MNKHSKYLAPALALSMFAAVVLMASGQFDGSEQIAATSGSVESASSVGVDDYSVKGVVGGGVPINQGGDGGCASNLPLPSAKSGQMLRCSDKDVASWIAVSSLYGVGSLVNDGINSTTGVSGVSFYPNGGTGVKGSILISESNEAAAVRATVSVFGGDGGFGFFQEESSGASKARNYLESNTSIGYSTAPARIDEVKLQVNGGVKLLSDTSAPGCNLSTRGTFWFTDAANGTADSAQVCAKNANGTYSWKNLF